MTTHQLQQKRNKKCNEVVNPTEVKSSRKSALPKKPREGMVDCPEVTSVRKSSRLASATPEKVTVALKQKPKSKSKATVQSQKQSQTPKEAGENVNLGSTNVRRKLELQKQRDEDENIDESENMDENNIEVRSYN